MAALHYCAHLATVSSPFKYCCCMALFIVPRANSASQPLSGELSTTLRSLLLPSHLHLVSGNSASSAHVRLLGITLNRPEVDGERNVGSTSDTRVWWTSKLVKRRCWFWTSADILLAPSISPTPSGTIMKSTGSNCSTWPSAVRAKSVLLCPWSAIMIVSVFWSCATSIKNAARPASTFVILVPVKVWPVLKCVYERTGFEPASCTRFLLKTDET